MTLRRHERKKGVRERERNTHSHALKLKKRRRRRKEETVEGGLSEIWGYT